MKISRWNKKLPKPRKDAWYIKVRGSYLPCSWQGWFMHFLLTMFVIIAFITVHEGHRSFIDELITMVVDLYVAGALFTFIAKHKS